MPWLQNTESGVLWERPTCCTSKLNSRTLTVLGVNVLAFKLWKKIEQSDSFRYAKLKCKQLIGKEPKFKLDTRLAIESYPGWVIVPELIKQDDIVYAIGICDDIGFELAIIARQKVQVFAFDPTPYSVEWIKKQTLPAEFNFNPWAVSDKDGTFYFYPRIKRDGKKSKVMYTFHQQVEARDDGISVEAWTIESMAKKLGHEKIDLLKIDVEGAEYDVIDSIVASALRPKLLLIEFHHRFKGIGKDKTINAVKTLRAAGYLIVNISATGREIAFVHQKALIDAHS